MGTSGFNFRLNLEKESRKIYLWYESWAVFRQYSLQNKTPEQNEQGTTAKNFTDLKQFQQWLFVNSFSSTFAAGSSTASSSPVSMSLLAIVYLPCCSVCWIVTHFENLKKNHVGRIQYFFRREKIKLLKLPNLVIVFKIWRRLVRSPKLVHG